MSAAADRYGGLMVASFPAAQGSRVRPVTADRKFPRRIGVKDSRKWAARMISALFPGPSVEAVSQRACGPLQCDARTIRRILDGTTAEPRGDMLALLCAYCRANGVEPMGFL
jgi:hypothetical protein